MIIKKTIYFDLDGTIADLYGVDNWLDMLIANDPTPYEIADPLCNMEVLSELLSLFQAMGGKVGVVSWLSKDSTREYDKLVRQAKRKWLEENLSISFDEIHIVKYGTPKQNVVKDKLGILIDDEAPNRNKWKGENFDPTEIDVCDIVKQIILEMVDTE